MVDYNNCESESELDEEESIQATRSEHNVAEPAPVVVDRADANIGTATMDNNSGIERSNDGVFDDKKWLGTLSVRQATTALEIEAAAIQNAAAPHFSSEPTRRPAPSYPSSANRRAQEARDTQAANKIEEEPDEAGKFEPTGEDWLQTLLRMPARALKEAFNGERNFN